MHPDLGSPYFGPFTSLIFVYVLGALTSGLSAVRYAIRSRRFRKQAFAARAAADEESAMLDEGDTVLHGCVEYAENHDHAMRVTIEQDGTESESSGSWSVNWYERKRVTTVAPFYVIHRSGERVRVEPGADARLEKEVITNWERTSRDHRKGWAEIVSDEEVWVTGVLKREADSAQGGYRGGRAWVMRPLRTEPMVVSALQPEQRLLRRSIGLRRLAVLFALTFIGAMAFQLRYHELVLDGRDASARVTAISSISVDEGADRCNLHVQVERKGARPFESDWDTECEQPAIAPGAIFPCFASFRARAAIPGDNARALVIPVVLSSLMWLALLIASAIMRSHKTWYDGKAVNDTESGRLS